VAEIIANELAWHDAKRNPTNNRLRSVNFHDARGLDHRRTPLPFRKAGSPLAVDVDARKLLAVPVVDRHLPVAVLSAPVAPHAAGLAGTFRFRHSSSDGTAGLL
jgi:predicted dienelactone hydrolase